MPETKPAPIDAYWLQPCEAIEQVPDYGLTKESSKEEREAALQDALRIDARNSMNHALCIGRHEGLIGEVRGRQ